MYLHTFFSPSFCFSPPLIFFCMWHGFLISPTCVQEAESKWLHGHYTLDGADTKQHACCYYFLFPQISTESSAHLETKKTYAWYFNHIHTDKRDNLRPYSSLDTIGKLYLRWLEMVQGKDKLGQLSHFFLNSERESYWAEQVAGALITAASASVGQQMLRHETWKDIETSSVISNSLRLWK